MDRKSTRQTNYNAISWHRKFPARLPSRTQAANTTKSTKTGPGRIRPRAEAQIQNTVSLSGVPRGDGEGIFDFRRLSGQTQPPRGLGEAPAAAQLDLHRLSARWTNSEAVSWTFRPSIRTVGDHLGSPLVTFKTYPGEIKYRQHGIKIEKTQLIRYGATWEWSPTNKPDGPLHYGCQSNPPTS